MTKLRINNYNDRNNVIIALVNAGYAVKIKEEKIFPMGVDYYIEIIDTVSR